MYLVFDCDADGVANKFYGTTGELPDLGPLPDSPSGNLIFEDVPFADNLFNGKPQRCVVWRSATGRNMAWIPIPFRDPRAVINV